MKVFRLSLEEPDSREPWLPPLLELPDEERLLELLPELPELLLDPLELRLELLEPLLLLPELLLPPLEFLLLLELRLLELRLLELRLLELRLLLDRGRREALTQHGLRAHARARPRSIAHPRLVLERDGSEPLSKLPSSVVGDEAVRARLGAIVRAHE